MVCLCHCLVKFAQKGGDESNISFESESEGLFISFYLFYFSFLSFCFFLFVCLLLLFFFLRVLISKLHSSEKVFWQRKSSFRRHFSLLYRKSYLKRGQGKHRQCCSEYRYIWCRSFSRDGWNSCYLLGRYKGQIGESKFSVCVMTLASRSAKPKALNLSTGRRYFFPAFFWRARSRHGAQCTRYLALHVRFAVASRLKNAKNCGYYVLHSYCVLHFFNPKGGNESTKTKLVEKFTKALPNLFGGLKVTITCRCFAFSNVYNVLEFRWCFFVLFVFCFLFCCCCCFVVVVFFFAHFGEFFLELSSEGPYVS